MSQITNDGKYLNKSGTEYLVEKIKELIPDSQLAQAKYQTAILDTNPTESKPQRVLYTRTGRKYILPNGHTAYNFMLYGNTVHGLIRPRIDPSDVEQAIMGTDKIELKDKIYTVTAFKYNNSNFDILQFRYNGLLNALIEITSADTVSVEYFPILNFDDYATVASLSNYATTASLGNYATTASLSNYATTASLNDYAKKIDVNNLKDAAFITDKDPSGNVSGLSEAGNYIPLVMSNYISNATSLYDADILLDYAIGDVRTDMVGRKKTGGEIFNDYVNNTVGSYAHAEGKNNKASGTDSHAEGSGNQSSGWASHAEGSNTTSSADCTHAEGMSTQATGAASHAEGKNSKVLAGATGGHAEGMGSEVSAAGGHAEGRSFAKHIGAHSEGGNVNIINSMNYDILSIDRTKNTFTFVDYDGINFGYADIITLTKDDGTILLYNVISIVETPVNSHKWTITTATPLDDSFQPSGQDTYASPYNLNLITLTHGTWATGILSHAEGNNTTASGNYSHSEGDNTLASGDCSHAEGHNTIASGHYSHAEGGINEVYAHWAHAEGSSNNIDSGATSSHAEGSGNHIYQKASHVEGNKNSTQNSYEHAQGFFNISNKIGRLGAGNTLSSIGFGAVSSRGGRKNAVEVLDNGKIYINGIGGYTGKYLQTVNETTGQGSGAVTPGIMSLQEKIQQLEEAVGLLTAQLDAINGETV